MSVRACVHFATGVLTMIDRLIDVSLRNRFLVIVLFVCLGAAGWWALEATPIDAIPDLSDNQVIVFTDWTGHSPQEVEDQITYPLTVNLQGLAGVRVVRSQSAFGFSMIYVIFEDNVDLYFARSRVLERLSLAGKLLPAGVSPALGPDATGVGHVFWYTVESPSFSLRDLRTLQDWFIRYQLNSVPGVAEVASVGGFVQQYQIDVDPNRLRTYNLPLSAVVSAVQQSNVNVGGNVLDSNGAWLIVRGVGLIGSLDDVRKIVVGASGGVPIYVEQIAEVRIGDAFRVASLVKGSKEAVGGVIVARTGVNTKSVIDAVKARIAQIQPGLPADVRIVPFYDRSRLIEQSVDTLRRALIEEIALVTLAHVIFLLHFRSILVVTAPLPLAVLLSFLAMYFAGISSNIMSLAGIAIAIGVLVDAGIVVTENAFRYVEQRGIAPRDREGVWNAVRDSTRLVGRPVFFSMAIILLAFVPVFALTGQEGKLFHPLAFTKTFAVLAATVISVTLVPVLCSLLLGGRVHSEDANPAMRALRRLYQPVLEAAGCDQCADALREERIRLQGGGSLQPVARRFRREIQQQHRHAGIGQVRGNLRAHGAGTEHRRRADGGWRRHRARAPSRKKSTTVSASDSRLYRRRLSIQFVAISSSAPKNILATAVALMSRLKRRFFCPSSIARRIWPRYS